MKDIETIFIREEVIKTLTERTLRLIALEGNINPHTECITFNNLSRDRCNKILREEMLKFYQTIYIINMGNFRTVTKEEMKEYLQSNKTKDE